MKFEDLTWYCAAPKLSALSSIILDAQACQNLNSENYRLVIYNTLTVGDQLFSVCMIVIFNCQFYVCRPRTICTNIIRHFEHWKVLNDVLQHTDYGDQLFTICMILIFNCQFVLCGISCVVFLVCVFMNVVELSICFFLGGVYGGWVSNNIV